MLNSGGLSALEGRISTYTDCVKKLQIHLLALCGLCGTAGAQTAAGAQDLDDLSNQVAQFLRAESGAAPDWQIRVLAPQSTLVLAHCPAPVFSLPGGKGPLRGSIRVGVRCQAPQVWNLYVSATLQEMKTHYIAASALEAGHILRLQDLSAIRGPAADLPKGAATEPGQLLGRRLSSAVPAGAAVPYQQTRVVALFKAGQAATLKLVGAGFSISSEGRALANASEGQMVQVRTTSGQVLTGQAAPGGIVVVPQ